MPHPDAAHPTRPVALLLIALVALIGGAPGSAGEAAKTERPRKIYAHYMGCFCSGASAIQWHATSGFGTMDKPDWAVIPAPGEEHPSPTPFVTWARGSIGGTYRNFALAPYQGVLPIEQAAEIEIRRAIRMGIDGFTFDAWAGGSEAMALFELMMDICEKKDLPFELTITPDSTCLNPDMPEFAPYPGDVYRKAVKWLLDRHGDSPKLARRNGKPLILAYGAQWPWVGYLWEVASANLGPDKAKEDYQREVDRLRTCPEGWKLMREAYRRIEKDVGAELAWEMDLVPGLFGHGIATWPEGTNAVDATIGAAKEISGDFEVIGQFLGDEHSPRVAAAAVSGGSEWSGSPFLQYENYGNFILAGPGTDWLRGGWQQARELPATLIQLITWNDYHETTNVAPGINSRYGYSEFTGEMIRWWKTGREPSSDRDKVFIFSHKYVTGSPTFPFQKRDHGDNVIEVLTILPKKATLRVPGRTAIDGSETWEAPAGLSWKQFPLTAGPVAVEVVRGGKVALRLDCPEPVSAKPFRTDIGKVCVSTEDERLWHEDFGAKRPYENYSEYGDVDADGLPNWFEMLWFGIWGDMATASAKQGDEEVDGDGDADGDGRTNREEHDAQTDPTDPKS